MSLEPLRPLHTWPVKSRGCQPNSSYFWARGEGRSPLKYIMFHLSAKFGLPFLMHPNSSREVKLLVPKVPKSAAI